MNEWWWKKITGSQSGHKGAQPQSGVQILTELIEVCGLILTAQENEKYLDKATGEFDSQGPAGSDALADFITELAACRSDKLWCALVVAERLTPSPKLIRALDQLSSAASSNPRIKPPSPQRFRSELFGTGHIAWTTSTATWIARKVQVVLQKVAPDTQREASAPQTVPTAEVTDIPSGTRVAVAKNPQTPGATLATLASWATPIAYGNVPETQEAVYVLVAVAENPSTPVETLEAICDRRHVGFWELTHNPNCPPHILKRIAASDNPFTAACARKHPNFP